MAKFRFRLAAVLEHRTLIEKEKQRALAVIAQQIQLLLRQIQDTHARIAEENRTMGARELTGTLDMHYIAVERRFVGNLHLRIALAMEKMRELERGQAAARAELLEATRARKVIEKLRDRQLAAWRSDQERKDAALTDEIGVQLAVRTPTE